MALYKTRFGLRLRACGEHPQAADSVGINVYRMRYAGVLISGLLGGLGGIVYITAGVSVWKFENGVAGFGFLALAVMIFGAWHPLKIALAALLFGFCRALGNVYSGFDFLLNMNIPSVVYNMLPVHHFSGGAGVHLQEVPRPQGRGHPLRQGKQMIFFPGFPTGNPGKTVHKKRFYVNSWGREKKQIIAIRVGVILKSSKPL